VGAGAGGTRGGAAQLVLPCPAARSTLPPGSSCTPVGHPAAQGAPLLPAAAETFGARMDVLRDWIRGRPETSLAVVSHWACLYELTGIDFDNCQIRSFRMSQLRM